MSESEGTDIIPAPSSIVRAPSEITTVNSSLAKSLVPSGDLVEKVTYWKLDLDTILDGLIPDPLPESVGKDNGIHHLNIIIFGKPNTGKCLTSDDVVPTTDGSIVRVGNLHPGLEVFSVDENFRLVGVIGEARRLSDRRGRPQGSSLSEHSLSDRLSSVCVWKSSLRGSDSDKGPVATIYFVAAKDILKPRGVLCSWWLKISTTNEFPLFRVLLVVV